MKAIAVYAVLALGLAAMPTAADAKGCIKGAVVGGVVGHYAGRHGVLGAAAGCVIGRHRANNAAREDAERQRSTTAHGIEQASAETRALIDLPTAR